MIDKESAPDLLAKTGYPKTGCYGTLHPTSIFASPIRANEQQQDPVARQTFRWTSEENVDSAVP